MILVRDDFLDPVNVQGIQDVMLSDTFPWYFMPGTISEDYQPADGVRMTDSTYDSWFMTHMIYKDYAVRSDHFLMTTNVLDAFMRAVEVDIRVILRIRANLTVRRAAPHRLPMHRDMTIDHTVLLYYVNDSDGDTLLFDGDTVVERVTPKAGRAVMFDGRYFHANEQPVANDLRVVVNMNVIT